MKTVNIRKEQNIVQKEMTEFNLLGRGFDSFVWEYFHAEVNIFEMICIST